MKSMVQKKIGMGVFSAWALVSMSLIVAACSSSDEKSVAGGTTDDAGITAVTDWEVAGVTQKGPFVTGSAVTVQELDGITLKQTGKSFKGSIKSDKGDFAIKDIDLKSQYAILEASGYYRDEITGKKSSGTVTLRALTDLSNRKTVNINLLTHLEYERVMYLVTEKKKPVADAKAQADEEILAAFNIAGDFGESEDLNIFESGDGNAALLAISVLMQADVDVAGLTERMGEFSIAIAEGGAWEDSDTKTVIADWVCDADLKGTLANVRKNVENWKYADSVPAFEKYVTNYWWENYGLGQCTKKREGEVKRNVNKLSKLYNEYFVCEKGRWHIPGDEPEPSSSASQDSHSELPSELQFLEEFCSVRGPVVYGDGEQKVWTCASWANVHDTTARDSAESALVDSLSKNGFVFERTMLSDSLKSFYLHSFRDSLSYIYSAKKNNVVYKIAMTKTLSPAGAGYGAFMFDVAIFEMKEGFEDFPISSAASSNSIYNPFDTVPELPADLAFIDSAYKRTSYMSMDDGKQMVWFYANKTNISMLVARDSAASEFVKIIGKKGFSFEGAVRNDSTRLISYDDTSYVYVMEKNNVVYKLALTKWGSSVASEYGFAIKVVVLKDGFEELSTKTSVLPEELFFVDKFFIKPIDSTEYANGKQVVWHGITSACGSGCDAFIKELVDDATEKGFAFSGTYSNDSLDNRFTEDSHVYTKTSGGKVYSVIFTKGDTTVCHPFAGFCSDLWMYSIKLIVRDEGFDEIPTETRKDYDSPKYREIPEDLKFVLDSTQYHYRYYSNDQKWTSWNCYTQLGSRVGASNDDYFDEAKAKADEYALMMEAHGFTLKSQETLTIDDLESMQYTEYTKSDYDGELTFYRFEKEVEKFRYEAEVFAVVDYYRNLGAEGYRFRARINITIYDK
jgi:hypothetical protein